MHIARNPFVVASATISILVLSACSPVSTSSESPGDSSAPTAAPSTSANADVATPPECDGFLFEPNAQVSGQQLGDCVAAAMVMAGTGTMRVDSSDGSSSLVDFQWDPEYSAHVQGDNELVLRGDSGWMNTPEAGWVKADPNSQDPQVMMATAVVELGRAASAPTTLAAFFATSSTWTLVDTSAVPASDSVAESAWLLTPDATMSMLGVDLSDVELWVTPDYLGAYFVATASAMGVTATTSNTFLQWGGPVDIPDPTAG